MGSRFDTQWKDQVAPAAQRAFGRSVSLERGGETLASFIARRRGRALEVFGQDGMPTRVVTTEFKFPSDDLAGAEPQQGDRIADGSEVFEIMPLDNQPAVEYRPDVDEYLVRTRKVS